MVVAAVARIVPHMPNFSPVEGLTLFGAAYLKRKELAAILPVLLLYVTDLFINNTIMRPFYPESAGFIWFSNYMIYSWSAMIVIAILGVYVFRKISIQRVIGATLGASIVFFLISNFGVWLHSTSFYTKDFSGLMTCYIAAIPFLKTSMISSFLFNALLFGGYEIFFRLVVKNATAKH